MILVGELALWVALLMAAWGAIVSFAGAGADREELVTSGERAVFATFACVVLATTRLSVNHTVRKLMAVPRLSFASAEETMELTGMMIGGVTVFALPDGLPIYVDDGLMPLPYVILGGGSRSTKVKIAPEVFTRLPGARVIAGLSQPV